MAELSPQSPACSLHPQLHPSCWSSVPVPGTFSWQGLPNPQLTLWKSPSAPSHPIQQQPSCATGHSQTLPAWNSFPRWF